MKRIKYLRAGESHGKYLAGIIEGLPAGVKIDKDYIQEELNLRKSFFGRGLRSTQEKDEVEIISGLRDSITTGAPVAFLIKNKFTKEYNKKIIYPRPGHADLAGYIKYKYQDIRDVIEVASARETAIRSVVGGFCKLLLKQISKIEIISHTIQIGKVKIREEHQYDFSYVKEKVKTSRLRCIDDKAEEEMIKLIEEAERLGDTLGGIFEVIAINVPVGLGSYTQWQERLDGIIAQAIMSIPAIKGVEFGLGFKLAALPGSSAHDEIYYSTDKGYYRKTNRAGGIEGGISNGQPIIIRAVVKPVPTLKSPLKSVNIKTKEPGFAEYERSDICVVPSAGVVAEAMLAIILADEILYRFPGDSIKDFSWVLN
jgi:chorismate synthase